MSTTTRDFRIERIPFRARFTLYVSIMGPDGSIDVGAPIVMSRVDQHDTYAQPTMTLSFDEAQMLMDELWRGGVRPTEGSGSAGSLAATERHLKDMQTIAMGLLLKDGMPSTERAKDK